MSSVEPVVKSFNTKSELRKLYNKPKKSEPVVLEISNERNSLERCMLEFASYERQTEFDKESGRYISRIWFDKQDETELLIRILSFGPAVKVIGPEDFLNQLKKRIKSQLEFNLECSMTYNL